MNEGQNNITGRPALMVAIPREVEDHLAVLAEMRVYGPTPEDVARHLIREGVAAEMRGNGLITQAVAGGLANTPGKG